VGRPGVEALTAAGRLEAGMDMGEGRVIQANGISIHVEDHGSGVPVLLLHGWPDLTGGMTDDDRFDVPTGSRKAPRYPQCFSRESAVSNQNVK